MEWQFLTWAQFDDDMDRLALAVKKLVPKPTAIYGIPRGGLPVAVALSHRIDLPLLREPAPHGLVVDDIVETGAAMRAIETPLVHRMAWVVKGHHDFDLTAAFRLPSAVWVVFPWESREKAAADAEAYYAAHQ